MLHALQLSLELFISFFSLLSGYDEVLNDESHTPLPPTFLSTQFWPC